MSVPALYAVVFAASLGLALLLTPAARKLALSTAFVDKPQEHKFHEQATPYLGGTAIWGACMVALLIRFDFMTHLLAWAGGACLLFVVGLVDDRFGMSPKTKMGLQILAACVPIAYGDAFGVTGVWALDAGLTLFWIVGLTNAVNLLDNMDGLSAGTTGISCLWLFFIAASNTHASPDGQFLVASLALAVSGACLGFLRYNFQPAQIFMGDAGSLFLGYTLAVACIRLRLPVNATWDFLVPAMVVALPILDTTTVTLLRMRAGRPVYKGGKDHTSHRLVRLGYSTRGAVLYHYGLACFFGALGLVASRLGPGAGLARGGLAVAAVVVAVRTFAKVAAVEVYGVDDGASGEAPVAAGGAGEATEDGERGGGAEMVVQQDPPVAQRAEA